MIDGVAASAETPTLFDWAGGRGAVERLLNRFYDLVEADELIAPLFGGKVSAEHRAHVTTWWCEVLGSQPGAPVVAHAPVPRWGWGEAPPFEG
jgi:truncated hemoglobin YjbI